MFRIVIYLLLWHFPLFHMSIIHSLVVKGKTFFFFSLKVSINVSKMVIKCD